ncbi:DUF2262 domain-containing protein [Deinococcus sp. 6GRE01]|uniref:DUF2262 domain-containing protein n=1 Tax=Deinococcus sp. 6GRE01 TaxID=2745873 RepID=UPI001E2A6117|nr:DUF2262 domain-containing protein [Deinococcus sp. 6GRE01]
MNEEVITHPVLGTLVKDGKFPWWVGQVYFGGAAVELLVKTQREMNQLALEKVASFIKGLPEKEIQYRCQVAYDIRVRDGDTVALKEIRDVDQYMERMALNFIGFNDDGSFQLGYDDGGLFAGHLMNGYFTASGELVESEIAG